MIVSQHDKEQNRLLHELHAGYGTSGHKWAKIIREAIEAGGYESILDFGAGKCTLSKALPDLPIRNYDPCIPGLDDAPEPAELVICGDVLEHVSYECIDAVLAELKRLAKRKLIVVIDTGPAGKLLPDGRNAHLIVEDAAWWAAKLSPIFDAMEWWVRDRKIYAELVGKLPGTLPTKRRTAPDNWDAHLAYCKMQANRYVDAFSRIDSVRMWEGYDDEAADMQAAVWIVEHMPDVAAAIHNIACLTSKLAMFVIDLKVRPDLRYWRQMIEQRFSIYDFRPIGDVLNVIGGPMLKMQGLKAVGVVDKDKRWEQIKAAIARTSKRAPIAGPHGRLAVLACYGPSLRDTIEDLREDMANPDADVISVSGAHDFLLDHGIAPTFHVECDPRAHKADNIARHNPGTRYLLASCVHEVLFDKLGPEADIALWHVASSEQVVTLVDGMGEKTGNIITGGGSVGLRSISLLYGMGYRRFSIYGMDCSFADAGKQQHAGKHAGEAQSVCVYVCGGRTFSTSYVLQSYATDFIEMIQRVNDLDITLHGDGMLQTMVASLANKEAA